MLKEFVSSVSHLVQHALEAMQVNVLLAIMQEIQINSCIKIIVGIRVHLVQVLIQQKQPVSLVILVVISVILLTELIVYNVQGQM